MTRQGQVDLIGFVFGFVGAGLARIVTPEVDGVFSFLFPIVGAALGWLVSRPVKRGLDNRKAYIAKESAVRNTAGNDAAFATALNDHDGSPKS